MFLRSCIIINLNGVSSLCLIWWWVWGRGERWECRFSKWCMCLCVLVIQASHKYHRVECQKGHIERSEFRDLGKKMTTVKWINVAGLEYFIIMILGLPWGINGQESTCQCKRHGFSPWVGKMPWRRNGNPLQYSCWENPLDRGVWQATVNGVLKSRIWLSNYTPAQQHTDFGIT